MLTYKIVSYTVCRYVCSLFLVNTSHVQLQWFICFSIELEAKPNI